MDVACYENCHQLATLEDAWERLSENELQFVPDFSELLRHMQESRCKFRLLTASENGEVTSIACFTYAQAIKRYEIATHKLFDLPVRQVSLFGGCVLGRTDEELVRSFFRRIIAERNFDVIDLGEIMLESPLHRALHNLKGGAVAWRTRRKSEQRWLIPLPASFDAYLALLRPTAKVRIQRDGRRFARANSHFRFFRTVADIDDFLRDSEIVSRTTYQTQIGYGLSDSPYYRDQITRLAQRNAFRGYIAYLPEGPAAFGWGEIAHRRFAFRMTGFDPRYRTLSAGTALIMHIIRDLIETTDCRYFDFGSGSDSGYKSRLATLSLPCARMQVAQISRPYSLLLITLDHAMNAGKSLIANLADRILGHGTLRQHVKRVLRPFGVGGY